MKPQRKIRKQTKMWIMRDGNKIRICDMDDIHLRNTINMIERIAKHKLNRIRSFYTFCPEPMREMAKDCFDREFDFWIKAEWEDLVNSIYWALKLEEDRRKEKGMEKQFYIAGVQFHQLKDVVNDLEEGMHLDLVLEPENKYDPNAVRIEHNEIMLGYVPKVHSSEVSSLLEYGLDIQCIIEKVTPTAKPWEMCRVKIVVEEEEKE